MKQTVLCLFMALSLLVAPLAHAAGFVCPTDSVQKIEKSVVLKVTQDGKQSDKAGQQCAHCAFCSHTVADRTAIKIAEPSRKESKQAFSTETDKLDSLAYGPPLEPPSHA